MSALSRRTLLRLLPMGLAAAALPAVTETPRADPIEYWRKPTAPLGRQPMHTLPACGQSRSIG